MTNSASIEDVLARVVRTELERALRLIQGGVTAMPKDELVTLKVAGTTVGVCVNTLRKWAKDGHIKRYGAGKIFRVRLADVEKYMAQQPQRGAAEPSPEERAAKILAR